MASASDAKLIAACKEGNVSTLKELMQSDDFEWKKSLQWLDKDDNEMDTPAIFVAVDYGHMDAVKLLLEVESADINIKDSNDYSPLQLASFNGNMEMVQLLLEHGAVVDQDALDLAKEHGHGDIATLLRGKIDFYVGMEDVDDIMIKASREGDVKKVQELIADGYDFGKWKDSDGTYQEYSPIYVAMKNGHIEVIREFLQAGVEAELHSTHFNHDVATPPATELTEEQIATIAEETAKEEEAEGKEATEEATS
ncbi:Ankyrin repeat [Seminavis robusta]|uniref:Ankyrin repeat n=1 Tax=Seminavis robusta TaxID=568900 RepID=A0A9N8DR63_9STRA|nr:Ankyrin repeat [Seminavis robusta]|eukprot:Sro293_g110080.1 Ankyrin repeat (253) ;mRNA; f:73196-73954